MGSSSAVGKPKCCDKDGKVDKSCEPTDSENKDFREHQEERNKRRKKIKTKKHPKGKKVYGVRDMTWKDKQCSQLLFDMNQSPEKLQNDLKKIKDEFRSLKGDLIEQSKEIATGAIKDKLEKVVGVQLCAGIGAAIGGVIGFFFGGVGAAPGAVAGAAAGETICGAAAVVDTAIGIPELWTSAEWVKEQISKTKQALHHLKGYQNTIQEIEKIKNSGMSPKKQTEAIAKIKEPLLTAQEKAVNANKCLKSKRCEMSPYKKSEASVYPSGQGKNKSPMDTLLKLDQPDGCCPGQQAHHVIPKSKVKDCPGYDNNKAPTVCLEGGNNNGTHGKLHKTTDENTQLIVDGEYKKNPAVNKTPASMDATIEASAQAMNKEFGCDKECVTKELKKFYKKLCSNGVALKDRNGKVIEKDKDNNGNEDI